MKNLIFLFALVFCLSTPKKATAQWLDPNAGYHYRMERPDPYLNGGNGYSSGGNELAYLVGTLVSLTVTWAIVSIHKHHVRKVEAREARYNAIYGTGHKIIFVK